MLGAIAGDVIGSVFESRRRRIKHKEFALFDPPRWFTDDTVLTVAVAWALLNDRDYGRWVREFALRYPNRGYGGMFREWLLQEEPEPYGSWGNGSAMRVSPVGFALDDEQEVLAEAKRSAEITHDHPEGIKGAQATALAVYLARRGCSKAVIRDEIQQRFGYDLQATLDEVRYEWRLDVSCQTSVPAALIAFFESESLEDAIRNAISLGGDSDTLACIAGGVAEAFYGPVPREIVQPVREVLDSELWSVVVAFYQRFGLGLLEC